MPEVKKTMLELTQRPCLRMWLARERIVCHSEVGHGFPDSPSLLAEALPMIPPTYRASRSDVGNLRRKPAGDNFRVARRERRGATTVLSRRISGNRPESARGLLRTPGTN